VSTHVRQTEPFRWEGIPVLPYREEGTHFRAITRQVLVDDPDGLGVQLRYFEVGPGGHSSLERHDHAHSVMVVRGRGRCLVGTEIHALAPNDLVFVPPQTWHQFRAADDEPLGFLCLVPCDRDQPVRPGADDLRSLRADPKVAEFVRP
jgi:quercetin dioxygenase-like cupin family protein